MKEKFFDKEAAEHINFPAVILEKNEDGKPKRGICGQTKGGGILLPPEAKNEELVVHLMVVGELEAAHEKGHLPKDLKEWWAFELHSEEEA